MIILQFEGNTTTITSANDAYEHLVATGGHRCSLGDAKSFAVREYDPDHGPGKVLKIGDWRDDPAYVAPFDDDQ